MEQRETTFTWYAARRAKRVVVDRQKANTQARKVVGVPEAHQKAISDAIKAQVGRSGMEFKAQNLSLVYSTNIWVISCGVAKFPLNS